MNSSTKTVEPSTKTVKQKKKSRLWSVASGVKAADQTYLDLWQWRAWGHVLFFPCVVYLAFCTFNHCPTNPGGTAIFEPLRFFTEAPFSKKWTQGNFSAEQTFFNAFIQTLVWSSVAQFLLKAQAPSWRRPQFSFWLFVYFLAYDLCHQWLPWLLLCFVAWAERFIPPEIVVIFLWVTVLVPTALITWVFLRLFCFQVAIALHKPDLFKNSWHLMRGQIWSVWWGFFYLWLGLSIILLPLWVAYDVFVSSKIELVKTLPVYVPHIFKGIFFLATSLLGSIYACNVYRVLDSSSELSKESQSS